MIQKNYEISDDIEYKIYFQIQKSHFYSEMKMWRQWNGKNVDTAH